MSGRRSNNSTRCTSSTTPSAQPSRRRARTGACGSLGSRPSAATCGSRSSACSAPSAADDALRIAIAFARTLPWDAHAHEVRAWLQQALDRLAPQPSPRRAAALYWDGRLALSQARFAAAQAPLEQALAAARALEDRELEAAALTALGRRAVLIADPSAVELCEAAIAVARSLGAPGPLADALLASAGAHERAEDWQRAAGLADEALALYREAGDLYGVAGALGEQGFYDIVHGRLERSERRLGEAVELRRQLGDDRRLVEPLIGNAWLDLARGSGEPARLGFLDCLALARHVGDQFNVAEALAGLSTRGRARRPAPGRRAAGRSVGGDPRAHRRAAVGGPAARSTSARWPRRGARSAMRRSPRSKPKGGGCRPSEAVVRSRRFTRAGATPQLAR